MCRFLTTVVQAMERKAYDPQVFAAMQTRFIVDIQEGASMIFFLNQEKFEDYKDQGVFPENEEDYVKIEGLQGISGGGEPSVRSRFHGCSA